jgi:DNA polymerase (family 10)
MKRRRNEDVANYLRRLHDLLVIGGYPEVYAKPYLRIANIIAQHPEDIETLARERRLKRISNLGWMTEKIIMEYLQTGTCSKYEEFATRTPPTLLDLLDIPGIGVKTVQTLYMSYGVTDLPSLARILPDIIQQNLPGLNSAQIASVHEALRKQRIIP